jgi:hypothetical protein
MRCHTRDFANKAPGAFSVRAIVKTREKLSVVSHSVPPPSSPGFSPPPFYPSPQFRIILKKSSQTAFHRRRKSDASKRHLAINIFEIILRSSQNYRKLLSFLLPRFEMKYVKTLNYTPYNFIGNFFCQKLKSKPIKSY